MIEQLVQDVTHMHGSSRQERAFMVGVLSLLDVLMGIPIEEAVSGVGVDEEVRQAVLTHGGVLGSLLGLCVSLQEADFEAVQAFARHWNIAPQRIMEVQQSAMLWAMTVVEQGMAGGGQ
jgi:EAL and modified HD-GYP domain-containing signal transduction protein